MIVPGSADGTGQKTPAPAIPDHQLLRCIGRGSYGEVWLARNILGEFRAVKVIYRRAFEQDRPYEREVEGIRKFEPVSRTHPSQLSVLHVGRNDDAGYFYYVMELADDATAQPEAQKLGIAEPPRSGPPAPIQHGSTLKLRNPIDYAPHTLKTDLDALGRVPVAECVRIGLALTTALEHLHAHGLVHRDVKPSNIIFVHSVPKLADIGLVASTGATMSFVGTSGFLPPEGPGTPRADLYSLGKVLYEASTGRDRQEFPKLPAHLAEWGDASQLVELNAVILKACAPDPSQRYQSAHEMAADLLLLQRGHSIKRLRAVERRVKTLTRAGLVAGALLVIAAGLFWGARQQARAIARQLYVADMNRAVQAWDGGNVTLARDLLLTHQQLQPEMLGFEWRLLSHLCAQSDAQVTLRGHDRTVWCVAFSADGQCLATGSSDRTVKLWRSVTGELIATLTGHTSFVHAVAFSPDGRLLATGSRDFTVKLWDTAAWAEVVTLTGHTDAVRAVAFSPDGRFLASGGEDKTLRWWRVGDRQASATQPTGITIEQLRYAPDGRVLAACGADTKLHFWETATHRELPPLELLRAQVLTLAYSSDGRILASAGYNGAIKLWDVIAGRELATFGRGAPVQSVAFAPDDQLLAAATDDGLVRLWSVTNHAVVATLRGHTANVRALAFAPKGERLATAGEDHTARLWDVSESTLSSDTLKHAGLVNGLAFSADGRLLATTESPDGTLRWWEADSHRLKAIRPTQRGLVWSVACAPDKLAVATGGVDGSIRLWAGDTLREEWSVPGHKGGVDAVVFSPDGRFIASGSRDQSVKVWRSESGQEQAAFAVPENVVRAVRFAPHGDLLAFGSTDGRLRLWNFLVGTGPLVLEGHQGEIRALAFSPDGRTLVSGGADRTILVWDVEQRKIVKTLASHTAMISSLAFSPDAKTLASGSLDSTVKLWNLRLFREVATLREHSGQVTQVAFAPDGNLLASSSSDGTVRLWRAAPNDRIVTHGNTVR